MMNGFDEDDDDDDDDDDGDEIVLFTYVPCCVLYVRTYHLLGSRHLQFHLQQ